jgi:AraC-like DNA-binding protein
MEPTPPTRFTVADFNRLGRSGGFAYRLPDLQGAASESVDLCIAEGRVERHTLRSGMTLVLSDIVAHHHYEASSVTTPQFSAIVMLQGLADIQLDRYEDARLGEQGGLTAAYGDTSTLTGIHPASQRLRSVNLSLTGPEAAGDPQAVDLVARAMRGRGKRLRPWRVPNHLARALDGMLASGWQGALQTMLREGVALQLLAHALDAFTDPHADPPLPASRDRQLLERVRERLHDCPGEDHTLEDLARLACMSVSTLRTKFLAAYGCSVFAWLRQRRLEVARDRLAQGWSVQQAAQFVGYRHATNFATAFRARYGVAPRDVGAMPGDSRSRHLP